MSVLIILHFVIWSYVRCIERKESGFFIWVQSSMKMNFHFWLMAFSQIKGAMVRVFQGTSQCNASYCSENVQVWWMGFKNIKHLKLLYPSSNMRFFFVILAFSGKHRNIKRKETACAQSISALHIFIYCNILCRKERSEELGWSGFWYECSNLLSCLKISFHFC